MPKFRVPHTLVLLCAMIFLAWAASFVVPKGAYQRFKDERGRELVQPGSYTRDADPAHLSPVTMFTAIPRGFAQSQEIIFFVFIIGGAIGVVRATGAIDAALAIALAKLGQHRTLLIAGGMALFAAGSSTLGMSEEYVPFTLVVVALCVGLRTDAITGVAIIMCGSAIGYGVAAINPFTLVIAQQIAGLPPTSGLGFRLAITLPFLAIGVHHVHRYAARVLRDPSASFVADVAPPEFLPASGGEARLTPAHVLVLTLVAATIGVLVWGISARGWYLPEMGAAFLAITLVVAVIARLSANRVARAFTDGAAELTLTALLIGFARAIKIVLEDGRIIDTVIHGAAMPLNALGAYGSAVGMLLIQTVMNFFIPSGSGQAYVTMPIMTPIADLTGVTRQAAVLAFQFGDGFSNLIVPTSAVLMGMLGIARVPYDRWFKFVAPLMAKLLLAGAIALCIAVAIGYE